MKGLSLPMHGTYKLGFSLAWTEASQAQSTGSFTMNEGTGFNVDVALSDQAVPAGGFDSGWDGRSLSKSGAGTLILSQQNTYSGSTTLNEGLLRTDVADSLARSSNVIINGGALDLNGKAQHLNRLSGSGGEIRLSGADLTIQNATAADSSSYAGTVSGAGNLIKDGTGSLTLSGQTLWSGETRLEGGALILDGSQGGAQLSSNIIGQSGTSFTLRNGATLSGTIDPTDVSIDAASTWIMTGNSDVGTMSLAGRIGMTPPVQPMTAGRTLTAQNWVGQGGTVSLYSVLGGDNSVTDRIIIDGGRATGNTRLDIHNLGGLGARTTGDGIKVVDTRNGGMTDIEAFRLVSRVAAGAYEYRLFRQDSAGQGENWYLRSGRTDKYPEYRNEVPLAMTLPALANRLGVDMLGTYHDRTGGREGSVAANGQSGTTGWGRVFGRSGDVKYNSGSEGRRYNNFREYGPSYDIDTSGFQVGADLFRQEGADGQQNLAGVYVSFGQADGKVDKVYGGRAGKDDMNGYGIGAYWTHLAPQGWYTDTVVQATYYGQAEARSVEGEKLDSRGWGLAASIEGGYPFDLGGGWNLEPQAQLIYQTTRLEGGKDSFGRIDIDNTSAVYGRVGARLSKPVELESGTKLNAWARANLWNTFGSDGRITFSDREGNNSTTLSNSLGGSWTQVGVGVSGEVNKTTVVFAGADYEHALGDGKGSSVGGRVGVNILW
ncbi:MAG: autotransporter outer membrane beta-barrel domain-containing protein [Azovibrio sp.]